MLFNSWVFLCLLLVTLAGYYAIPRGAWKGRIQALLLTAVSFFFYAWENPPLVLLLAVSVTGNAGFAYGMIHRILGGRSPRAFLTGGILFNLALLGFFKYAGLFAETFFRGAVFEAPRYWFGSIPLPIGISFYTFQAISLLADLRTGRKTGVESLIRDVQNRSFLRFTTKVAFFISFFPQLIAGPIVKAHDFICQIGPRHPGQIRWDSALRQLLLGYFLKMYVADNLKEITSLLGTPNMEFMAKGDLVCILYAYSFQIFADFAGYSLIALGLAGMFGYALPVNFHFPYMAASVTDFWRRWHVSLSSWLREYLYFPLGGNRKGERRTYLNLFIVMFLGGLWHGAAWSYAIWGGAHGVLLAVERRLFRGSLEAMPENRWWRFLRIGLVFHVVSALWLLFLMPDFAQARRYVELLLTKGWDIKFQFLFVFLVYGTPVILYHLVYYLENMARAAERWKGLRQRWEWAAYALMLALIFTNSGSPGRFIYFQF